MNKIVKLYIMLKCVRLIIIYAIKAEILVFYANNGYTEFTELDINR